MNILLSAKFKDVPVHVLLATSADYFSLNIYVSKSKKKKKKKKIKKKKIRGRVCQRRANSAQLRQSTTDSSNLAQQLGNSPVTRENGQTVQPPQMPYFCLLQIIQIC